MLHLHLHLHLHSIPMSWLASRFSLRGPTSVTSRSIQARAPLHVHVYYRPGPLASCRVDQCLGAANALRDMPIRTCPRVRVQCKSSQRGYHKLIHILASRPRWPEGVAFSSHPPHCSCKRGRVPPAYLHTCVALSESGFWGILLDPRSVSPAIFLPSFECLSSWRASPILVVRIPREFCRSRYPYSAT